MSTIQRLLFVPSKDPDDARRRRLLNILLLGVGAASSAAILVLNPLVLGNSVPRSDLNLMLISALAMLGGVVGIYLVNRFWSGRMASSLFLFLLLIVLTFSDSPQEVAAGRSLFVYAIPIIMASVLLSANASFLLAGCSSLVIILVALNARISPDIPAVFGFLLIALVSWLAARSLERALKELRVINTELDRRVAERTRDLSDALLRVQIENAKSQAILEGIADGVLVFDNELNIIVANPAISALLGSSAEQACGASLDPVFERAGISAVDRVAVSGLLAHAGQGSESIRMRMGAKTLSVNAALVRDSDGRAIGKVAVFRDFTREAEVEAMKSIFVATVSHEMRTPLSAILGYGEMLRESVYGPLSQMQANITDRVLTNARRLLNIVNDLLDQAQIEAGKVTLHMKNFAPEELIESLRSVMEKIVHDKGLELITAIDPSLPSKLAGDPERLQQVLVNLVNNAVKFTEQGNISVRLYQPDPIHWAMEVSDTGCGIPATAQKYIFEPFRQVDPSATRQHGGIGLGLTIVKNLVNLMKGDLALRSQEGAGSTFTVTLPYTIL